MSANPSTSSTSGAGPCGACKFLRRKCVAGCIFAPYFDSDQGAAHFAAVHKVFGASNVSKLLLHLPVNRRLDAVVTICYEAQARLRDPVYGCVSHIFALQQQVVNLQAELSYFQTHLATLSGQTPPPPAPQSPASQAGISINDLPTASPFSGTYDLSSLFNPMVQPSAWAMQPMLDPRQFTGAESTGAPAELSPSQGGAGNLQELLHRPSGVSSGLVPCKNEGPHLPPHK